MAELDDKEHSSQPGPLPRLRRRTTKASAPPAEQDERSVHHESEDGKGFTGWLYHHADGTMAAEDGTVYEHTDSGPALVPELQTEPDPKPEPELKPEPEPEPDKEPEPERGADPEPEPEAQEPVQVPDFVEYTPSEVRSYLLAAVVVLASVSAVLTLFLVAAEPEAGGLVLAAALAALAASAGWALSNWTPTFVAVREGVLELNRGSHVRHFDLCDPDTRVDRGFKAGSPSWRTTVTDPDGHRAVIGARQVKAKHFTEIVEYHRSRLRQRDAPAGGAARDDSR